MNVKHIMDGQKTLKSFSIRFSKKARLDDLPLFKQLMPYEGCDHIYLRQDIAFPAKYVKTCCI